MKITLIFGTVFREFYCTSALCEIQKPKKVLTEVSLCNYTHMVKQLLTKIILFVAVFILPLSVWAATATELAATINAFTGDGSGSLIAIANGKTVTVTGTLTDVTTGLSLDIDEDVTVVWQATISTGSGFPMWDSLIEAGGLGSLNVVTGGSIAAMNGDKAILSLGVTIIVNGGTIKTTGGTAIYNRSENSTVTVNAGTVSATTGTAIFTQGEFGNSTVTVNDGTVSATSGVAIRITYAKGTVNISGGTVSATTGRTILIDGMDYSTITVSGGIVSSDGDNNTITIGTDSSIGLNVTIGGTGKVQATGQHGRAINANGNCNIEVKDEAQVSATTGIAIFVGGAASLAVSISGGEVSATTGYAIFCSNLSTVTVSGGLVFAYGDAITGTDNVIFTAYLAGFTVASGTGVVIAWNQASGNTTYTQGYSDDIVCLPATATAVWDRDGTSYGISYANGTNTGFIPLNVTVEAPVDIENINNTPFYAYAIDHQLGIVSPHTEQITIYSIMGVPLYSVAKNAGLIEIPFASTPGSVFIIRGNVSGMIKFIK